MTSGSEMVNRFPADRAESTISTGKPTTASTAKPILIHRYPWSAAAIDTIPVAITAAKISGGGFTSSTALENRARGVLRRFGVLGHQLGDGGDHLIDLITRGAGEGATI